MTDLSPYSPDVCLNCGKPVDDKFCASCGQKDQTVKRPLPSLLSEISHAVFELDSKAYRTVFFLFTKPGYLTREYIEGRRVSYTPPLRLFLVLSILLFFLISVNSFIEDLDSTLSGQGDEISTELDPEGLSQEIGRDLSAEISQELDNENLAGDSNEAEGITEVTDGIKEFVFPFLDAETNLNLVTFLASQVSKNYEENKDDIEGFFYGSLDYITFFMFLIMPMLALILKVLYFFSGRYYVEHMILTLHNHAFLIFAMVLRILLGKLPDDGIAVIPEIATLATYALTFWMIIYPFLSLKNYFEDGYALTALKFFVATTLYSILLALGSVVFFMLRFVFA